MVASGDMSVGGGHDTWKRKMLELYRKAERRRGW